MRVVASDIDGTLLTTDGILTPTTARALARIRGRATDTLVLLTAKPFRLLDPVLAELADFAVCDNGSEAWDLTRSEVILETRWAPGEVAAVIKAARKCIPGLLSAAETRRGTVAEAGFSRLADEKIDRAHLREVRRLPGNVPARRLMFARRDLRPDALLAALTRGLEPLASATHSGSPYVEVGPRGGNKATALARLCAAIDVDRSDVISFGDMPNDIGMLRWAGIGVAMANAHPSVLRACDEVAGSCDEDGVARYLRQRFGL